MEWKEKLEHWVAHSHCPVTFSGDMPGAMSRWLVRSGYADASTGDALPRCELSGRVLALSEVNLLPAEEAEANWKFVISDELERFQQVNSFRQCFTMAPNKYGYNLGNIYCEQACDALIQIIVFLPAPVRAWINGELIFTGSAEYFFKEEFVMCRLAEGCNTVLIESPLGLEIPLHPYGFTFKWVPMRFLEDHSGKHPFLDESFIDWLQRGLQTVPEKACFAPGEDIALMVLPRYIEGGGEEDVKITVYNAGGERLARLYSGTCRRVVVPVDERHSGGVLRIEAESVRGDKTASDALVFFGDFHRACAGYLERAAARPDVGERTLRRLRGIMDTPRFFRSIGQYIPADVYRLMFSNLAHLSHFLDIPPASSKVRPEFDVWGHALIEFTDHRFDRGFREHSIFLPAGYDPDRTYPLVVYFNSGHPKQLYTEELPWLRRYACTEAVVINTIGVGWTNYVDDLSVIHTLSDMIAGLNIDRSRIYAIGFCAGGVKAFKAALRIPDLFAGIASMAASPRLDINRPEFDLLDNIEETAAYGLFNIEDWFFNHARNQMVFQRFKRSRTWTYYGFMHNELNNLYNSKALMDRLIAERKPKYPKRIRFTVIEPPFNKSHWVVVDYIEDLNVKAVIHAEVTAKDRIEVHAQNMTCFSLLLNRVALELDHRVELCVNGVSLIVRPGEYARVTISLHDGLIAEDTVLLTQEAFEQAYDRIGFEEGMLGIKQVYWQPCKVVKPGKPDQQNRSILRKLNYLLQIPMPERGEFYRYDSCDEMDMEGEVRSNYIHIIDAERQSGMQRQLLDSLGIAISGEGMTYRSIRFTGDSFACIKCANPRNPDYSILIVAFNRPHLEAPIVQFFNSIDDNPLFFNDAVIYNQGRFTAFRNRVSKNLYPLGG